MNQLMLALIVGFVGAVIVWIAARLHYFRFKSLPDDPLPIRGPIWGFLGYLIVYFFIAPFVVSFMGSGLRTLLQNHGALFITLLQLFSLFHFSLAQGISNLSILFSLFIFALFLNFLYERQRSLIAPIALHMTFNSISVIRIILISN